MRKIKNIVLVVGMVLLTMVFSLYFKSFSNLQVMEERSPITLAELEELVDTWDVVKESKKLPPETSTETESLPKGSPEVDEADTEAAQQPQLERVLTEEQRKEIMDDQRKNHGGLYNRLSLQVTESMATAYAAAGIDDGAAFSYYDAGRAAELMGDWKTASLYYRKALELPLWDFHRKDCAVRLAKMVDDPEVADALLRIACPPDSSASQLYEATDFAGRTESKELFQFYLGRLVKESPEIAGRFDWVRDRLAVKTEVFGESNAVE
jgi:hypothetical protein